MKCCLQYLVFQKKRICCLLDTCILSFRCSAQNSILEYFHSPGLVCTPPRPNHTFLDMCLIQGRPKLAFNFLFFFLLYSLFFVVIFLLDLFSGLLSFSVAFYTFKTLSKLQGYFQETAPVKGHALQYSEMHQLYRVQDMLTDKST